MSPRDNHTNQSPRKVVRWRPTPAGKASKYISQSDIQAGDKIVIVCRVSAREQDRQGNLDDQEVGLRAHVAARGGIVIDVIQHVGSGWDPFWLGKPAALAEKHGAVLLAECTNRFVRSVNYNSNRWLDARPSERELQELARVTEGARLTTVLDPDASPREERAYQQKRGQCAVGGRGRKVTQRERDRRRREQWLPVVLELHRAGHSQREIGGRVGVSAMTVSRWLRGRENQ